MIEIARVTDRHSGSCGHGLDCCPHSVIGIITQGSPNSFVNGLEIARLGDAVIHDCPHCGTGNISSASTTVFANGIPVARRGDRVTYPGGVGRIDTGSPNTFTG